MDPLGAALVCLCCAVTVAASARRSPPAPPRYSVREEEPPGTLVGNLARDLGLTAEQFRARRFRALRGTNGSDYLAVSADSGEVWVRRRLDREAACRRASAGSGCSLLLGAVLERPAELVRVVVDVLDVNDHAPRFPAESALLEVAESAAVGTRFALDGARDPDAGANALRGYAMEPDDGAFALETRDGGGGALSPVLVVRRALDRERRAAHEYVLTALDGGRPPLSGTVLLTVRLLDTNDNAPAFERPVYRALVPEDAPAGTLVARLHAWDPDDGANGEVEYAAMLGAHETARDLFAVDSRSGLVTLVGALDHEEADSHEMHVRARDRGPDSVPAYATVLVRVLDVNDNAPVVRLLGPTGDAAADSAAAVVVVSRGASPGHVVAFVHVRDRDSGANGRVTCTLEGASAAGPGAAPPFALRAWDGGEVYALATATRLDRGATAAAEYNLTVVARDDGAPPLVSVKTFTVRVTDTRPEGRLPDDDGGDDDGDGDDAFATPFVTDARPEGRLLDDSDGDDGDDGDGAFATPFVAVVALAAASCVLNVAAVAVVLRCKRENKELRTYHCGAAARARTPARDEPGAAARSGGEAASATAPNAYEDKSFLPSEAAGAATPALGKPPRRHPLRRVPGRHDLTQRPCCFLEPNNRLQQQSSRRRHLLQVTALGRSSPCRTPNLNGVEGRPGGDGGGACREGVDVAVATDDGQRPRGRPPPRPPTLSTIGEEDSEHGAPTPSAGRRHQPVNINGVSVSHGPGAANGAEGSRFLVLF
ncbi:protocadherin-10-like [Lethenteron reissneri]|uniref:protocadherin-10-like n=2 Tax=Lethenteron reissneri TaxID=7753 RepID=UPI002AB7E98D|nr:protocadherin-10-like [Lethenteron reissneri]